MKKTVIIGGDERFLHLYKKLKEKGLNIETLGLFPDDNADLKNADVVILPIPASRDKVHITAPLTKREILVEDVKRQIPENTLILSGGNPFDNRKVTDYLKLDDYAILNAVPTAEGAIAYAIENTKKTLFGSRVLVIGFGRVGKVLANRLFALGAKVTVSARNSFDKGLIKAFGYDFSETVSLNNDTKGYDVIFNTIDLSVLENKSLKTVSPELVIDLSTKGGIDLDFAESLGIKAVKLPALPAKTAPCTAAEILFDTIYNLLPFKGEKFYGKR